MLTAGTRLGRYEIVGCLGVGGMGEVYRARDTTLGREVAIKVLPEELAREPERVRRFELEARAASALADPHIVMLLDVGESDGIRFLVTELVDGGDLRQLLQRGPLPLRQALDLAEQVASGLAAAHEKRLVHRDLKPENILVTRAGVAKIADFGLAKLVESSPFELSQLATDDGQRTTAGVVLGTLAYMSPEQARGTSVDQRSDVFAFGAVLYELLCGRRAFARATAADTTAAILHEEPGEIARPDAGVTPGLDHLVAHCLEKLPERRFQSMRDVAFALHEARSLALPVPAIAAHDAAAGRARKKLRWRSVVLAILGAPVLAGALIWLALARRAPPLTERDTVLLADVVNTTGDALFDGTMKQALAVTLGQSPFLNLVSDAQVRETLGYMNRPPEERITREVAREISQRRGVKAVLLGAIASLGSHFVITLEAVDPRTGDEIAGEHAEAVSREQVLATIDQVAVRLRHSLGESLPSIARFDTPLEQATTSSLEALRVYTLARQENAAGRFPESIQLFRRAVELDPSFASAHSALANNYFSNGDTTGEALRCAARAYALRDRVTERERLQVSATYQMLTGDTDGWIATNELFTRTYPRDAAPRNNLAFGYVRVGDYEKAVEQASEGLKIDPALMVLYSNLAWAYRALGRYDEAKAVIGRAHARHLDYSVMHQNLYYIAFLQGDAEAMRREVAWAAGKQPEELSFLGIQADSQVFAGRLRAAEEIARRMVDIGGGEQADLVGVQLATLAVDRALVGDCAAAESHVARTLAAAGSPYRDSAESGVALAAIALAICNQPAQAEALAASVAAREPTDQFVRTWFVPLTRAAIATGRGEPDEAIRLLQKAKRYELGQDGSFWPQYLRGQAFLRRGSAAEAAAQFRVILDHRSISPTDVTYPLARLGLARAAALGGDAAGGRRAYQDFLAAWKDADPELPILAQARRELAKL